MATSSLKRNTLGGSLDTNNPAPHGCAHAAAVTVLQGDCPVFSEGEDRQSVLQAAAMAAKWWEPPRDALDSMVLKAAALHELEGYSHLDFMPFDASVKVRTMPSDSESKPEGWTPDPFHPIITCDLPSLLSRCG